MSPAGAIIVGSSTLVEKFHREIYPVGAQCDRINPKENQREIEALISRIFLDRPSETCLARSRDYPPSWRRS